MGRSGWSTGWSLESKGEDCYQPNRNMRSHQRWFLQKLKVDLYQFSAKINRNRMLTVSRKRKVDSDLMCRTTLPRTLLEWLESNSRKQLVLAFFPLEMNLHVKLQSSCPLHQGRRGTTLAWNGGTSEGGWSLPWGKSTHANILPFPITQENRWPGIQVFEVVKASTN